MKSNRLKAIESKDTFYFTGKPCIRGHVSKRYAYNGTCIECNRLAARVYHYRKQANDNL